MEYAPAEALGHFNLGVVFTDQGNRRAAIAAYETVVTLLPSFADAHYHLGTLYEAEGQHAQAIRHYAGAKKLLKGKRPSGGLDWAGAPGPHRSSPNF